MLKIEKNNLNLKSTDQNYIWKFILDGPHTILDKNSGLYSYNNYYNYYYNYNYNYYNIGGIILLYGKVAIHMTGYRSEYAKIKTLFTIRESDAKGPKKFLNWIKIFNSKIEEVAKLYQVDTKYWQDFIDEQKKVKNENNSN